MQGGEAADGKARGRTEGGGGLMKGHISLAEIDKWDNSITSG